MIAADQNAPARLFTGSVMHARLKPVSHRFSYQVFSVYLDLDRLADVDRASPVFSVDRFNLLSFDQKDHGRRDGSSVRSYAEDLIVRAGIQEAGGKCFLLCFPRVLGFVFNPLSIYWRFDASGSLIAIIYEVSNTFGQSHAYVAPVARRDRRPCRLLRQEADKEFYVSPFLDMKLKYRFRLAPPDDRLHVRILETDGCDPVLAAAWSGRRQPFETRFLLKAFVEIPLLTFKVVCAIRWQALRLWFKGLRFQPRPKPPQDVSFVAADSIKKMESKP